MLTPILIGIAVVVVVFLIVVATRPDDFRVTRSATIAAPMIEPSAIPPTPSYAPTAPTPRFSGSKPMNTTLIRNDDTPKPADVPTTEQAAEPKEGEAAAEGGDKAKAGDKAAAKPAADKGDKKDKK